MEIGVMVLTGLLLFGFGYNWLVGWMERNGYLGYTAFLVVGGSAVTIGGAVLLIGLDSGLMVFLCFAASGLPMTLGSMWRHARRNQEEEQTAREIARNLLKNGGA